MINIANNRYGRLTAIEEVAPRDHIGTTRTRHIRRWLCRCDCGQHRTVDMASLVHGRTRSCGCLKRELSTTQSTTHGLRKTPEYNIWALMKDRCANPNNPKYANYGGRGITVCERWLAGVENFYADMGPRPSAMYSIERRNNDGPYSLDNCKWATVKEQAANKRPRKDHHMLTLDGQTKTLAEWSRITGLSHTVILKRLARGWALRRALGLSVD